MYAQSQEDEDDHGVNQEGDPITPIQSTVEIRE